MHIKQLRIERFRNLECIDIEPVRGLNYFFGDNGAGKTSILEALFLLSRGKSFRTAAIDELIQSGFDSFRIVISTRQEASQHHIGLERSKKEWRARMDQQDVPLLSELSKVLPIVLMEPNSHMLVSGGPDGRRRFLDWGVFHVEPTFLDTWRQYSRTLKQRNAALRHGQGAVVDSLDEILIPLGEKLNTIRQEGFERLDRYFSEQMQSARDDLRDIRLRLNPGWKAESLQESLELSRQRDFDQGISQVGPHRADILLERSGRSVKAVLSRGEQKIVAACLLLSQAELMRSSGQRPVILLDDLASEFDDRHLQDVLQKARKCASQVWVSGVQRQDLDPDAAVFHVEHGQVHKMV